MSKYQDFELNWKISPSFSHDLFHFFWSIAEGTFYSKYHSSEKTEWRTRLAPEIINQIDKFTDYQISHLSQSSLGTMFYFSNADSIDGILTCLAEPEPMKTEMLKAGGNPGWTDSIFQHLETNRGKLQMIISTLQESGYEEYWHQKIKPIVIQRCEELRRELSQYDVREILDNINGLLGSDYHVTHGEIILAYFSAGLAYHLPDNSSVHSFIANQPIEIERFVSTLIHEWLHNFTQSSELHQRYDGLYSSPFFARSRELLLSVSGDDEELVAAAEKYLAVKLGITSPEEAFYQLYRNNDGSQVLGVITYYHMNEKALAGKTYEAFLIDLFKSGRIQAENLEQQYIATMEAHIGHERTQQKLNDIQVAYSTYKMKNSILEIRRKGQMDDLRQVIQMWIDNLKRSGYHLSNEVATETQVGAKNLPLSMFDDVIHVELEKAGQTRVGIDIIVFQDFVSAQNFWNETLGQENPASLNNFLCVFPSILDRQHVAKGCWIQERHLINIFVIVPYTELPSATDVIQEIAEAYPLA